MPEEPLLDGARADYADAFEMNLAAPDSRSAEAWVRCGLEESPPVLRRVIQVAHRQVLRLRLAPASSPGHVLGWTIVRAEHDVVHLEAHSPLGRGVIIGRRPDATSTLLTTYLFWTRPRPARLIWTVVGPLHRRVAPYLLERAAAGAHPDGPS
jgi:hypothetical protein